MRRAVTLFLFLALPLAAQTSDQITFQRTFLLRNVTGTAFNPGPTPHHPHLVDRGVWTTFYEGAVFVTRVGQTGPAVQRNEFFSTNWFAGGAQRAIGHRGLLLFRGRASLEPLTVRENGYPQMLQYISAGSGGPLIDATRAHDLIGEAAADIAFRVTTASFIHLYVAPIGVPALGTVPYAQRASSEEFGEAPYAYDVQETMHDSTGVVTAGFGSRWLSLEGSVFHDAVTTGRHTTVDLGDIDSRSARLIVTPVRNLALQVSQGELGDDKRKVTTGSLTYGNDRFAASAIWTHRELENLTSFGAETTVRATRNTFMGRVESVDRPPGFLGEPEIERTTHFAIGYMFDFLTKSGYRAGVGANVDYHTQSRELPKRYGHKPQGIYVFLRLRTDAMRSSAR